MPLSKWMQKNKTRKFNGKMYRFHGAGRTKADANRVAKLVRDKGGLARVVDMRNEGKSYAVYVIKKY